MASVDGAGPDPFDPGAFADAIRHQLAAGARPIPARASSPAGSPDAFRSPAPRPLAARLGALL
jgi:hypothetical protein